jgi:hypothetical protein
MVMDSWGSGVEPVSGKYVVGQTKRGDAIVITKRPNSPLTGKELHEMFVEARSLGLLGRDGQLRVYGTTSLMGESGRFRFTQVDMRSCKILW